MRIFNCLTCLLFLCIGARAQNLKQEVRLHKHEWPLDALLQQVTSQTGVRFSINTRKFPPSRTLRIKTLKQPVSALLAEIRNTTGIAYTQVGTHIILLDQLPARKTVATTKKKPELVMPAKPGIQPSPENHTASETLLNPTAVRLSIIPLTTASTPANVFSVSAPRKAQLQKLFIKKTKLPITTKPVPKERKYRNKKEFDIYKGWFSKAGAATDDVLYLHNSILVGHTYAYGIIGYTTNLKQGGLRYGIGGSMPVKTRWDLHLQLSTGKLDFKYDSSRSVTKVINTNWHQAALKMEFKISEQVRIMFGPVYNLLKSKTNFFKDTDHYMLTQFELEMLGNHMNTLYTIKDEVGQRAGTLTKSWIGLQAGIYFNLNFSK
ncbi:hypothetical protein [Pseudoflavitalea rhizosphaerae]|uniref:hypothetical protein n=1 Tax=Pseudoflavitalea rhizosphaerae TaxID=1884793 RepID=UPI000F8E9357|nr:hypothetical protein [Pseudoflavitalea rhizosphaerae]